MSEILKYKAFGLVLHSEIAIAQLLKADDCEEPDVIIRKKDLSAYNIECGYYRFKKNELTFALEKAGKFRVTNGNLIEIDPLKSCTESLLGVYLMGSAMGAILHQRGYMPIHGSCVTDGKNTVLITGDSGAGKSTLAAEFLYQGWKLLTDDVAPIYDIEGTPLVQAGYPSQKLWQDSMKHYEKKESDIHSLYFDESREKFGIHVADNFYDGCCPLKLIVRLIPVDGPCNIEKIASITGIDQLMRNTYRLYMVVPEHRERHFKRCVTLASKVPMVLVTRQKNVACANTLYEMITNFLNQQKGENNE